MYKDQFNILFISHVEFGIQISLYHFHFTLLETVCFGCLIGSKNLTPNLFCSMLDSKFWLYNGDSRSNQRSNQSHTCSAREFVKKPTRFLDMMTSLSNKKLTTANIEMSGKMLENPYVELFKIFCNHLILNFCMYKVMAHFFNSHDVAWPISGSESETIIN